MESPSIPAWVFTIEPYEGESLSHFLGRFRRANLASVNELGQKTGLGAVLGRWEKFRFIPPPSDKELAALASVVQVDVERLKQMLPPKGVGMKLEPIRLCAACYGEVPCIECRGDEVGGKKIRGESEKSLQRNISKSSFDKSISRQVKYVTLTSKIKEKSGQLADSMCHCAVYGRMIVSSRRRERFFWFIFDYICSYVGSCDV